MSPDYRHPEYRYIDIDTIVDGEKVTVSVYPNHIVSIVWLPEPIVCCTGGLRYVVTHQHAMEIRFNLLNPE